MCIALIPTVTLALAATPPAEPHVAEFPDLELSLELPPLEELEEYLDGEAAVRRGLWTGTLGETFVEVSLEVLGPDYGRFVEPDELTDQIESYRHEQVQRSGARFVFEERELRSGSYGAAPYASIAMAHNITPEGDRFSTLFHMAGLLPDGAYTVNVECRPAVDFDALPDVTDFLEDGIRYGGELRDHEWTDEEADARWRDFVQADLADEMREPLRTDHYIVLTNASGGKVFARKLEECYEEIQEVFPFPEVEGRRLMPIFIFRTRDQYVQFQVEKHGRSPEQARQSAGIAFGDCYVTMYESPNDPTHIHELTHQIFKNRLRLAGGGSWFQEGVAEYIETRPNERGNVARQVKKGRHVPLREFFQLPSLLYSASQEKGESKAHDNYKQAALLIEFLRESKFGRDGFPEFLAKMGRVPRGDLERIEAVLMDVWEVDVQGLDEEFVEYCKKR